MTVCKQIGDTCVPLSPQEEEEQILQNAEWQALQRAAHRSALRAQAKAGAGEAISAVLPLWKQSNLHTRYLTLLHKGEAQWTEDERTDIGKIQSLWSWIDAVRQVSAALEEQIQVLPEHQLATFVWPDWPAPPVSL